MRLFDLLSVKVWFQKADQSDSFQEKYISAKEQVGLVGIRIVGSRHVETVVGIQRADT
jgi:hypothetical protein